MESKKRIRLKVASPCSASWDKMKGDDAVRFCGLCKENVYQISNMSTDEVERMILEAGGEKRFLEPTAKERKICVRFYQRADGTLLTKDCSVGLRKRRRKMAVLATGAGVASALGLALSSPASPTNTQVTPAQDASKKHSISELLPSIDDIKEFFGPEDYTTEHVVMGLMLDPEIVEDMEDDEFSDDAHDLPFERDP
jgi:hypothetical protein